ncbi:MAG TPA: TonB family protein [Verrucomicrobiae bacterium]|nr:TonB family protein [Verrucomicrobiae bacterium]
MNRLQKKCVLATAGIHLLLLVILFVGPAFFSEREKTDDLQVLDVIPANLIDAQFNSGVKNAQPPAPTPVVATPKPTPTPPAPKPVVQPAPAPSPTLVEKVEKFFKPEPAKPETKPTPKTITEQPHKIQVNTQLVTRTVPKNSATDSKRADAIKKAIKSLKQNFSPSTTIDLHGDSSAAYASYASAVKSIYEQAWQPPTETASDDANVKVRVTIANDGTVVNAQIIVPSGDASVDASVQQTLERVTFIGKFPEGAKEKERTYTINFNLKAKRMLG